jgi:FAD/FMN-containing dehydrogenase
MSSSLPPAVLDAFRAIVGAEGVRDEAALEAVDRGWDPANLGAGVMLRPRSTGEVAAILRLCDHEGIPIVPQGGRTGLVGGGVSRPGEVIVSLDRMNRIARLDPTERVAVVEAGVTLEALQSAAAAHGLEPGIDLPSRGTATIGGMASTNAGGVMAFRNGVMRHRVLGLEAVLADGSVYDDLTRVVKNAAGYDLKHLFIGAEGTLGVITTIAVKLDPTPRAMATALFALPSVAAALETIRLALDSDGGRPRAAEAMWRPFLALNAEAQGWRDPALDISMPIFLLLALGGPEERDLRSTLQDLFARVHERFPEAGGIIASSARQDRELWRLREDTETVYRAFPAAPSFDVSVPLSEIDNYVARVTRELAALDGALGPFLFGHLADGNLHVIFNRRGPFDAATSAAVETILYRDLRALGGSFSAEHGVGSKRIHSLRATVDEGKLAAMNAIKRALDPKQLMNPGKVLDPGAGVSPGVFAARR